MAGGLAGAFASGGILSNYSEQFKNFRAGKGFVSNAALASRQVKVSPTQTQAQDALTIDVKPFARKLGWTGKTASHEGWALSDGSPLVDFGPNASGRLEMNVYRDIGAGTRTGAPSTYTTTTNAFKAGKLIYGSERAVSTQSLVEGMDNFTAQFIDAGQKYQLLGRNSNFSADWYGTRTGVGTAEIPGTWTPGSDSSDDN